MKTGLLCSSEIVSAVAKAIRQTTRMFAAQVPLVIDPVFVGSSGYPLLEPAAIETYEMELFPLAGLITPNIGEAERLLGTKIKDRRSMRIAGKELEKRFGTAILLKGGHLADHYAIDLLFVDGKVVQFSASRVRGIAIHGTGCTHSAAITAGLASGLPLEEAVGQAKKFVTESIERHFRWKRGTDKIEALNHLT
jgi:hydroxymethylpyrimidine kinase/phosphomethylpyrimidine kinase